MITNEIYLAYPVIFEPKENLSGKLKYSACLLIDKSDTQGVKDIQEAINAAIEKGVADNKITKAQAKSPKFKNPLRDGSAEYRDESNKKGMEFDERYFLNASSNKTIGVVDCHAKPLLDQAEIYAGVVCRADISFYAYSVSGNSGVGVGLQNLMKVRDGEAFGGGNSSAENVFAAFAEKTETF